MIRQVRKTARRRMEAASFSAPPPKDNFRHPWQTVPSWNPEFERWEATLRCGFVNGLDPLCHGYLPTDEDRKNARELELWDGPYIPLNSFRIPGSLEGDRLPGFFKQLGVREEKNNAEISELGGVMLDLTEESPAKLPPRILRAMDFYIAVARATYAAAITPVDPTGASGLVVDYAVTYDTSRMDQAGTRARLMQAAKFQPVRAPTFYERLFGQYQDEGEDRLWLSTVFLLSPEDVTEGEPDETWTPYVEHNEEGGFWNLRHEARNDPPSDPPQPIRLFTGLAAGFGDIIGNQMLSFQNELTALVSNALNTTTNEGKFWSI